MNYTHAFWNTVYFCAPAVVLPVRSTLACHTLYALACNIQKRTGLYFSSQTAHKPFSATPLCLIPNKFAILNSCVSTGIALLLAHQVKGIIPTSIRVMLVYRLCRLVIANIRLIGQSIYRMITHGYQTIPLDPGSEKAQAQEIEGLIKKIEEIDPMHDFVNTLSQELIDPISLYPPSLPVKIDEKHYLDKTSINQLKERKCPVCKINLKKENLIIIDKDLQAKIIARLTEIYEILRAALDS